MKTELEEMVNTDAYRKKYMRSILYIKNVIDEYIMSHERGTGSPVQIVEYRMKSAKSIADKLEKKGYAVSCANAERYLSDLAGIRVVCMTEEDVYELEDFLCRRKDVSIVRRKDYIKKPKANGYRSLHLIAEQKPVEKGDNVRVELQLRTQSMHCWAEKDHRLFYKRTSD